MTDKPKQKLTLGEDALRERAERVNESDVQQIAERAEEIENKFLGRGPLGEFAEELLLGLGLVKDFATGRYRTVPFWVVGALVIMYLYIVDPIDIIPDYLIGIGQIDDLAVMGLCLMMVRQEIARYKSWREEAAAEEADEAQES